MRQWELGEVVQEWEGGKGMWESEELGKRNLKERKADFFCLFWDEFMQLFWIIYYFFSFSLCFLLW